MIVGNKSDLDGERAVEQGLASSKINELGLTYMEVSAKTGSNIKEFFKEMACVIAGTKKSKEEPTPKPKNGNDAQPARPVQSNNNNISLEASKVKKDERKNKKCECWLFVIW